MNPAQCWIVMRKELTDTLRDRKAVAMILVMAIVSPLIYVVIQTVAAGERRQAESLVLPVAGAEHAPALVEWLTRQTGVEVVPAPADPEQAVRDRTEDVVLVIDEDFRDQWSRVRAATVVVMSDTSHSQAAQKAARARELIGRYSAELASLRLLARGIAPEVATPVRIELVDVSSLQQRMAGLLLGLPIFFAAAALMCAIPLAVDATAGERERGSLEPLLLNPLSSATVVSGKWLAASVIGSIGVVACILVAVGSFRLVPWHEFGTQLPAALNQRTVWSMLALYVPLAVLMSALAMCLSTFARSFKEAQSLTAILMPIPFVPMVISTVVPLSNHPWLAPVPLVGQSALALDVLGGNAPEAHWYVLAAVSTLTFALVLVALAARLFRREAIVFGR
jgi:sodium transport system permease protein